MASLCIVGTLSIDANNLRQGYLTQQSRQPQGVSSTVVGDFIGLEF